MLRINLLPAYVTQRRKTKRLVVIFAVAALACVVGPLFFYGLKEKQLTDLTAQANAAVEGKAKTDALRVLAKSTLAQVDPIKAKIDFVAAVLDYPRHWLQLYNTLADTTPRQSFIYSGTTVTAPAMVIKAYSPSVAEVGRYLQAMYREPDFATVAVDKVPGYPDNVRTLYYYGKTLVYADSATATGGGAGGSGSGPGGGSSSSYPTGGQPGGGYPTGGGGAGGQTAGTTTYNTATLGPNSPANIPPGVGPPPPELTGSVSTNGGPSGPGQQTAQAGGPQGGAAAASGFGPIFERIASANLRISPFATPETRQRLLRAELRKVRKRIVPRGFDITVTATLKDETLKALTPPALPGSAPPATARPGGFPGAAPPSGARPTG